jgi:hypothetical protein
MPRSSPTVHFLTSSDDFIQGAEPGSILAHVNLASETSAELVKEPAFGTTDGRSTIIGLGKHAVDSFAMLARKFYNICRRLRKD